jgi:hypothetical protein
MPIEKSIELNGFQFTLATWRSRVDVMVDIGDKKIAHAIQERDSAFLSALEKLVWDSDEIDSVLLAEESFSMWLQSSYAENRRAALQQILNSEYASDELKDTVRRELGQITRPSLKAGSSEWNAMLYGVYQAMPDAEKEELHEWERKYIDGGGKFATSDWPGWEKYIGERPKFATRPERTKRRGYIYLVWANTGEYKIGYTIDVGNRIKAFSVQPPFEYKVIHTFPADDMEQAEILLHDKFSEKRIKGEWFSLNDEDVSWFLQISGFENGSFSSHAR